MGEQELMKSKRVEDSSLINLDELRYILTLRYYPKGSTFLPKLTWKDFVPYTGIEAGLQPMIEGAIKSAIDYGNPKKVGIAISGGVDSTSVLALARKLYPRLNIKTLCITFGEDERESQDAEQVSDVFGTHHFHFHIENPLRELPQQIAVLGVPRWNAYTYYIFEYFDRYKVDMLLTGDGGDEMFGGYAFRYKEILDSNARTLDSKAYVNTHKMDWVPDQERMFGSKIKFRWEDIYATLSEHFKNPLSKLGQTFLADYNGKLLYDFAPTNIAFAKHFKQNMFAPLLNNEVIYTAAHLPYHLKYDHKNNVGKIFLRQILMENFAYKSATKPKIGFGMNRIEMWQKTRDSAIGLFDDARCCEMELINKAWLVKAQKQADSGRDGTRLRYVTRLFMILALEVWLRLFVTKELKASDKL
ncbi:MAG TPA: asparagine synthase C-terminal domain-containing protein [Candidatus Bathyarchaeia archaeon]|nr:asparagine synthase C-terminal domain-containing protein [Candidatus Bathyarchaeia archaeon]